MGNSFTKLEIYNGSAIQFVQCINIYLSEEQIRNYSSYIGGAINFISTLDE
jgi:hypothetical protein